MTKYRIDSISFSLSCFPFPKLTSSSGLRHFTLNFGHPTLERWLSQHTLPLPFWTPKALPPRWLNLDQQPASLPSLSHAPHLTVPRPSGHTRQMFPSEKKRPFATTSTSIIRCPSGRNAHHDHLPSRERLVKERRRSHIDTWKQTKRAARQKTQQIPQKFLLQVLRRRPRKQWLRKLQQ